MMYLHYLDPHGPYDPPPEFYQRFQDQIFEEPVALYSYVRNKCQLLIEEGFGPGEDRFEDLVLRYDAEIAFVDHSLEALFRRLRELELLENTMVVLTADHGQEFLEHDYVEHAWTLYRESLHIPLIFWAPGKIKPGRIDSLVSTVDILPTLLSLLEITHERDDFDGTPLFRYERSDFHFSPPEKPYIAEVLIQHRSLIRTVIQGPWKYIASQRWLPPAERPGALSRHLEIEDNEEFHLDIWGPIVHEELYDLAKDPREEHALPMNEEGRKLRGMLDKYRSYCQQHGLKADPRSREAALSKEELENLRSLGYIK
jgi:arylsulfatase A-like enzyme